MKLGKPQATQHRQALLAHYCHDGKATGKHFRHSGQHAEKPLPDTVNQSGEDLHHHVKQTQWKVQNPDDEGGSTRGKGYVETRLLYL